MPKYSTGDKLAIALTCLAGVMALILFWIDKTPLTASLCILAMAALLVYPVIHFVSQSVVRIVVFVILAIMLAAFGWNIWPRLQEPTIAAPPSSPQANAAQSSAIPSASGKGSVAIGGSVTQSSQGNCSPNIIGGSSTVNCSPVTLKTLKPGHLPDPPLPAGIQATLKMFGDRAKIPVDAPNALKLYIGDSVALTTKEDQPVLRIAGKDLLGFHRKAAGITIDAKVFDSDGKIVVGVEDNVVRPNTNNIYYVENPDPSTMIVHDQHDETVLNIKYINPRCVRISGIFRYGGSDPVVITDDSIVFNGGRGRIDSSLFADNGGALLGVTPLPQ